MDSYQKYLSAYRPDSPAETEMKIQFAHEFWSAQKRKLRIIEVNHLSFDLPEVAH